MVRHYPDYHPQDHAVPEHHTVKEKPTLKSEEARYRCKVCLTELDAAGNELMKGE